ncbi:hypothetical protein BSL78_21294 [Apostichopus japonicus]|uniref:Uncharacterized protein n=1 Tax=Stichopus japonicus TaxID=307972 RepID=A0A2G8K1I9_STIJA|nr:hypothetical protein BSL78_21294 [Apostichopus japonicus]
MQVQSSSNYTHEPRDNQRAPSPTVTFSSTGLEKLNFPNSAAFFDRRKESRIVSTTSHDDREDSVRQQFASPFRGRPFRGFRGRGFPRGRGYSRGSFNSRGRSFRGSSYRGGIGRGLGRDRDRWAHDKFEDQDTTSYKKSKKVKEEKGSKKDKKSKKSDRERRSSHK